MTKYILFDDVSRNSLLPLTYLRPSADIRCGILTFREKWEFYLKSSTYNLCIDYLKKKFPIEVGNLNVFIKGTLFPNIELREKILQLKQGQALVNSKYRDVLAFVLSDEEVRKHSFEKKNWVVYDDIISLQKVEFSCEYSTVSNVWDIFSMNDRAIAEDFKILTNGKKSAEISPTNQVFNKEQVFIEQGAIVECSVLNASAGPIYIGKDAEIMEYSAVRGPFALCEHATLKMGAKIYGATTIGPYCKVGGEVNNSVFFGFSNKAHDGFIGNSVIAEWCNIGADTNNSNLKNTYEIVKLWSYPDRKFISTGLQFCGLIMADHSKCSINTMFNTGTVVGVNANIFGTGFPRNFVPSFSWGATNVTKKFQFDKAVEIAKNVCDRRGVILSDIDIEILYSVYQMSE